MRASDYRAWARNVLSGKWVNAVLVGLVAAILGGGGEMSVNVNLEQQIETVQQVSPELGALLLGIVGVAGVILFAYGVVMVVIGSVVQLGYIRYNLKLVDGQEGYMGDLFVYFSHLGKAFLLRLWMGVLIMAWSLLFVIPGVIASYSYAMAPYIMAEDPECEPLEAIRRSKEMMDGHKMDLFILKFSFIGWSILSAMTLGLGQLLLTPYVNAATAVFYRDLQRRRPRQIYPPELNMDE